MADRYIEVSLVKRGITATAKLLDDRAPITCAAVWDALPLAGDVYIIGKVGFRRFAKTLKVNLFKFSSATITTRLLSESMDIAEELQ